VGVVSARAAAEILARIDEAAGQAGDVAGKLAGSAHGNRNIARDVCRRVDAAWDRSRNALAAARTTAISITGLRGYLADIRQASGKLGKLGFDLPRLKTPKWKPGNLFKKFPK